MIPPEDECLVDLTDAQLEALMAAVRKSRVSRALKLSELKEMMLRDLWPEEDIDAALKYWSMHEARRRQAGLG